jgi:hypothetical protein
MLCKLTGGDRRSIGKANLVVREVIADPQRVTEIIHGMSNDDRLVRMRCGDVAEKLSRRSPEWIGPHANTLLVLASNATEKEMRWHLAQILPRLKLDPGQSWAARRSEGSLTRAIRCNSLRRGTRRNLCVK